MKHEIHIHRIAESFSIVLHEWLGKATIDLINHTNKSDHQGNCASHEFCDANMAMLKAYSRYTEIDESHVQIHLDTIQETFGKAWRIAKVNEFNPSRIRSVIRDLKIKQQEDEQYRNHLYMTGI